MDFNQWNIIWALSFGVMAVAVVSGNIVTIVIFLKRRLRKRPHFLLISLAVADLLVGLLSIPLYITLQYVHLDFKNAQVIVRAIADWMDMFAGFTSIFTIAVMSLERMCAIGWPFRHRVLNSRTYIFAIAIPWILALVAASTEIIFQYVIAKHITLIIILVVCLSTPLVLTFTAYFVLWKKERSRLLPQQVQEARELKLTKTLALITGAFLVTWLPFEILIIVYNFCISCRYVPPVLVIIIKLLQYGNSAINIVIYPVRNKEYRKALVEIIAKCKCLCQRHQAASSANVGASVITLTSYVDLTANTVRRSISSQQTSSL